MVSDPPIIGQSDAPAEPVLREPDASAAMTPPPPKPAPADPTRYGDWEKNGRCIDFGRPAAHPLLPTSCER